jgi:hypothetical protein
MDATAVYAIMSGFAGAVSGYLGGKQIGRSNTLATAVNVVELLQVQVATLTEDGERKNDIIADLRGRVEVLEGLVTQRAEVEVVRQEVVGVRGVVDRIAAKVGVEDGDAGR